MAISEGGVALLLVTHNGATWLPGVLDGLAEQSAASEFVATVAVDTGSRDASAQLCRDAGLTVLEQPAGGFGDAIVTGLKHLADLDINPTWLWLLQDDARPAPDALRHLLDHAAADQTADVLGAKIREWPMLRRLLEVGVTISGTGSREVGLELGEYDQGQHDQVREVLAVNTAGMLVRRETFVNLGGLDPQLPVFESEIDFGWRAAAAGKRTVIVPSAVVFHARGSTQTLRPGRDYRGPAGEQRRAALYLILANSRRRALAWRYVRLSVGSVLRALGMLLLRMPVAAGAELRAAGSVIGRPRLIARARRQRAQRTPDPDHARVKRLLAPWWTPYRHGLDVATGVLAASTTHASVVAERRAASQAAADPSSTAARIGRQAELGEETDSGPGFARAYLNAPLLLALVVAGVSLILTREAWGPNEAAALSPAPGTVEVWWTQLTADGVARAPAYVAFLALIGEIFGSQRVVSMVFAFAVPLALWGAWRFLVRVGTLISGEGISRPLVAWGAITYAVLILASGAWGEGRLAVVGLGVTLPWLAHTMVGLFEADADRRWRAGWRSGLVLSIAALWVPLVWLVVLVLAAVAGLVALACGSALRGPVNRWAPAVVACVIPVVLLAFWWYPLAAAGDLDSALVEIGRTGLGAPSGLEMVTGRLGGGVWEWVGLLLVVLAVIGLVAAALVRATVAAAVGAWSLALVTASLCLLLAAVGPIDLAGAADLAVGYAPLTHLLLGCLITSCVVGAHALTSMLERHDLAATWQKVAVALVGIVVVGAALAVPAAGIVWFTSSERPELTEPTSAVPTYVSQDIGGTGRSLVVVSGDVREGLTYEVITGDGVRLGEDEARRRVAPRAEIQDALAQVFANLDGTDRAPLASAGIDYVVMTPPVDPGVAENLDANGSLRSASASPPIRAWRSLAATDGEDATTLAVADPVATSGAARWGLWLTGVAVLLVLVLSAPTLVRGRR